MTNNAISAGLKWPHLICLLIVIAMLAGCSKSWSSDEIYAWVVDASTGEPVPGAVVEVNWQLVGMEGSRKGQLAVFEVISDDNGRFYIPAWGPRTSSALTTLYGDQPVTRILKRGYEPLVIYEQINEVGERATRALSHMRPDISGKSLALVAVQDDSLHDYAEKIDRLWESVVSAFATHHCDVEQVPRLLAELHALKLIFEEAGVPTLLSSQEILCQ